MALIIVVVFVLEIFFLGIMSALLMLIGVGFGILLAIAS